MSKKKVKKIRKEDVAKENENLPGFDIRINTFGEVQSTYDIDEVNAFLNENLRDKKLKNKIRKNKEKPEENQSEE